MKDVERAATFFGKTVEQWAGANEFTGTRLRGVVYAWCYHDDKMGYQRCNAAAGEIRK